MRCPKCGYNSFDYLDSCKKCGKDLVEFKQRYGLKSILLPGALAAAGAAAQEEFSDADATELTGAALAGASSGSTTASEAGPSSAPEPVTEPADAVDFGFDFMGDSSDDDDLTFDELFEDAADDEDVEETLEAPKPTSPPSPPENSEEAGPEAGTDPVADDNAFSFDLPEGDEAEDDELENDFGFDPEDLDLGNEDFAPEETRKNQEPPAGSGEGPQNPFDLPESSQDVGAPVDKTTAGSDAPELATVKMTTGDDNATDTRDDLTMRAGVSDEPAAVVGSSFEAVSADVPDTTDREGEAEAPVVSLTGIPSDPVAPPPVIEPAPATLVHRCLAFVYDSVILMLAGLCFLIAGEMTQPSSATLLPSAETLLALAVPYFLIFFFLVFSYYTLFHFLAGQTPGEMLVGLRVETMDGAPLTLVQAFLRSVGSLAQLLPLGLGFCVVLLRPDRRGWNDQFAGTRIVAAPGRAT